MRYYREIFILVFIAVCFPNVYFVSSAFEDQENARLSRKVLPEQYKVYIDLDKAHKSSFTGMITIQVLCKMATDEIVLHNKLQISVQNPTVTQFFLTNTSRKSFTTFTKQDLQNGLVALKLNKLLSPNEKYEFELHFKGIVGDNHLKGIYKQLYDSDRR